MTGAAASPALPSLDESIRALGLPCLRLPLARSFVGDGSGPHLAKAAAWLPAAATTLSTRVPLPRTVAPFVEAPFYRMPGSYRSVCYCPGTLSPRGLADGGAVVALKGLEPCLPDFGVLLRDLRRPCYTPHSIAEHLVFEEGKIPGCLGLGEAVREAERAAAVQDRHRHAYGGPARLPLPLFVYRHDDRTVARTRAALRDCLGTAALEAVEPILARGLGAYAYHYPAAPVRVRDIAQLLGGLSFQDRMVALLHQGCDPGAAIEGWVRLFVRILHLGFLPGSLASFRSGICCQPQNACLDGGFVDLDSLTPLDEVPDEAALQAGLQFSIDALLRTVQALVLGDAGSVRAEADAVRVDLHAVGRHVSALLEAAIADESRPGLTLDPRVRRHLAAPRSFADLAEVLRVRAAPASAFEAAACDFHAFGRDLIRAARP